MLNGQLIYGSELLPDVIEYVATQKSAPTMVGNTLADSIRLMTAILKEKMRIINATSRITY